MDRRAIDCPSFLQQGSCKKGDCPYRHSPAARQQKTCKFWLQGNCKRGTSCVYKHPNPYIDSEGNIPGSVGNTTVAIGGLMLAGYFGYKLYEGASRYLWGDSESSPDEQPPTASSSSQSQQPQAPQPSSSSSSSLQLSSSQGSSSSQTQLEQDDTDDEKTNPFACPITLQVMKDPVITPQGICYERQAITDWLAKSNICPITRKPLTVDQLITCYAMRNAIAEYSAVNALKMSNLSISNPTPITTSQETTNTTTKSTSQSNNNNSSNASNSNTNTSENTTSNQPQLHQPAQARSLITIEVAQKIREHVQVYTGQMLCAEDGCIMYPFENCLYITFPASANYIVSRSTGYVVIQNLTDVDVDLISREREASLFDPYNIGGKVRGTYVLKALTTQGFDYRGSYCIEARADPSGRPVKLLVTDYANSGGGKGAWLSMGTE